MILGIVGTLYWNFYLRDPSIEPEQSSIVSDVKEAPKTIAVLPFDDLSPEKDQEYFVLGLSEEILNTLTKIPDLHVTSKTSSFAFKNTDKTIQEIAQTLEREYILEGSVRKAGDALRITAQLIHVADDRHLWSNTYDKEFKVEEIFLVQENIANAVAYELKLTLGIGKSHKQLGGTADEKAYEHYLIALGKANVAESIEDWENAIQTIKSAINIDPEFALAYVEKARFHQQIGYRADSNHANAELINAAQAVKRATELEPNLGPAYVMYCNIDLARGQFIEAEINCRKALDLLNGKLSGQDDWLVSYLHSVGKFKQANDLLKQIRENDPLHKGYRGHYMFNLAFFGDFQDAEDEYQICRSIYTDYWWHDWCITSIRLNSGNVLSLDSILSADSISTRLKEYLDSPENGSLELRKIYQNYDSFSVLERSSMFNWATYFGDSDFIMDVLQNRRELFIGPFTWYPIRQKMRKTLQFKKYIRDIGLIDYWKEYGWPDICRPVGEDDFECD